MACCNLFFHSAVLGCDTKITVTIPEMALEGQTKDLDEIYNSQRKFPTLYLCHGGAQDSTAWVRYSQVEMFAQEKKIMTVCFDAMESFCCDMVHGRKYFTFASEELPRLVQSMFPSSPLREDNFVAGFSMGGHCAMKLALRCPEKYAAVMAMSGAKDQVKMSQYAKKLGINASFSEVENAFGPLDERIYGTENDLLYLAQKLKDSGVEPPMLYMACGTADYGYNLAYEFKEYLDKVGLKNEFISVKDAVHDYSYANEVLRKAIMELFTIREIK